MFHVKQKKIKRLRDTVIKKIEEVNAPSKENEERELEGCFT